MADTGNISVAVLYKYRRPVTLTPMIILVNMFRGKAE